MKLEFTLAAFAAFLFAISTGPAYAESIAFVQGEGLYLADEATAQDSQVLLEKGVRRLFNKLPVEGKIFSLVQEEEAHTDHDVGFQLVKFDVNTRASETVMSDVVTASYHARGNKFAVWDSQHVVQVITAEGIKTTRVPGYGAAPLFSSDGRYIAYLKLADVSVDGASHTLFENAFGIAVYDTKTGESKLVTNGGGHDFAPAHFSRDMQKLYFNSTRPYPDAEGDHIASLWVVDLQSGVEVRLTNQDKQWVQARGVTPILGEDTIWSPEGDMAISSNGLSEGVWLFTFSDDGYSVRSSKIADGESPQWVVPGSVVAFRSYNEGRGFWRTLKLQN